MLGLLLPWLTACGNPSLPPPEQIGKLVIVTDESTAGRQVDNQGRPFGFAHDLGVLFAQELGVEARFVVVREAAQAVHILKAGRAHLAAAGLAPADHPALRFTPPILDMKRMETHQGGAHAATGAPAAWAFPAVAGALRERAETFLARSRNDGTLERLADRSFGHLHRLNAKDVERFIEKMQSVLPRYRRHFVDAQDIHGIDWRLLAALAYQESHWNPLATSYTNVRGMMMLTEDTADRLRVTDRLDARQSILAGARYLAELKELLPPEVAEPDRTWLALAAYNLGMGHLNGARFIATLVKRDPNSWYEMKQVLPLLAKPQYYSRLKSGAARGGEAVIMTENIRAYFDILRRYEEAWVSPQAFSISSRPPM